MVVVLWRLQGRCYPMAMLAQCAGIQPDRRVPEPLFQ